MERIIQAFMQEEILRNMLILGVLMVSSLILEKILYSLICLKEECNNRRFTIKRILGCIKWGVLTVSIFVIWGTEREDVVAFIGLFSAGMTIAMKDIWLNILGGAYIILSNQFKIGDRIEIQGQIGDVIDIKLLGFNMLEVGNRIDGEQSTGRIIHMPNMIIFSSALINYEKGFKFIWNEVKVTLKKECEWHLMKNIMEEILKEVSGEAVEAAGEQIERMGKKYAIYYNHLTPIVYLKMKEGNVELTGRYLCEPRKCRNSENLIWSKILCKTKGNSGIEFW